jgi:GTPase SAR1 family protein
MVREFVFDVGLVCVTLWDTAGQQRYRSLNSLYCRDAQCVIVVYSVFRRDTFESVSEYINEVRNCVFTDSFIVLIGHLFYDSDRFDDSDRVVTREEAEEAGRGFGVPYFEMDDKTGQRVEDGFHTIVKEVIRKMSDSVDHPDSKKPLEKERKGLFGLFGSKKTDSETTPQPRPPASIPIQTPKKERKSLFDSKKIDLETEFDSDFHSDFDLEILP